MKEGEFVSNTLPSVVSFLFNNVPPPSMLYIQRDDQVVLQAVTGLSNEVVTFNIRLLLSDGTLVPIQQTVRPPNTRAVTSATVFLDEGYLLSVSCLSLASSQRAGTFVRCFMNRGAFGTGQPGQLLFSDYVTPQVSAGYPGGRILSPTEGPGRLVNVQVAAPAAGQDWAIGVPTNARWRPMSLAATLNTAVAVANRQVQAIITVGGSEVYRGAPNQSIAASLAARVTFSPAPQSFAVIPVNVHVPIPPEIFMGMGDVISSSTVNIQAADQWGIPTVGVEEWIDV